MTFMDTGRVTFRGLGRGFSVRMQNGGCNYSVGHVVGVVVLRVARDIYTLSLSLTV